MVKFWKYLVTLCLPLLIGSITSVVINYWPKYNPVIIVRIELSMLIFLVGFLVTLAFCFAFFMSRKNQIHYKKQLTEIDKIYDQQHQRFIQRLDHEMKNPLTALHTILTNLNDANTLEEIRLIEQNSRNAIERLTRLLGDLRKLSELQTRKLEYLKIDIPNLLEETLDAAQSIPIHQNRHINLVVSQVPWTLPPITGDRDLLGLAIYNLLDNALKYSAPGDKLEVRALEDGRNIVIEVADNGIGIPPEDTSRVFEELYRGTNARGIPGSGLGLALVKRIISLHNGEITLRSRQHDNRGTIFTIRLPVTQMQSSVTKL